ncbi:MAG: hypothetical protein LF885_02330 [Rickettsia endosymbiont of Culicoides impunctatus]|nr:MAG: hypothetical protein LF885_01380 [Rickettsia endosymbiont of Culicoides impunctatus]UCM86089.1 MAG: hypothetical protein LF885_02330 [Rickettsia endosymbiont of Culicoides impunctatus]
MEANAEKRCKYLEDIKDLATDALVYIDESGIEMNITKIEVGERKVKHYKQRRVGSITKGRIL